MPKDGKKHQQPFLSLEDLTPYIKLVGKNWWMLVAFVVLGYGMGRLVTHRQVDVHKATAELLLTNEQDAGVMGMMGRSTSMSSAYRLYNDDVQNQLRVLRSYDLIGRVIDKIDDPVDYALVGRIKESPVEGFAPVAIECDVENWSASMTGKPIDLFVVDASHYRPGAARPNQRRGRNLAQAFGLANGCKRTAWTSPFGSSAISAASSRGWKRFAGRSTASRCSPATSASSSTGAG